MVKNTGKQDDPAIEPDDPFAMGGSSNHVASSGLNTNYVAHTDGGEVRVGVTQTNDGAEYTFNFDNVPEQGEFPIPPGGLYIAMVTDFEVKRSKTDKPMIVFTFTLLKHQENPDIDAMNAKVWDYIVVTLSRVRDAFRCLGLELNGAHKKSDIIGRQCVLLVKHDMYEQRKTLKVARYMPHPAGIGHRSFDNLDEHPF